MRNQFMNKNMAVATGMALATAFVALPAFAQTQTQNMRGVITGVSDSSFKLESRSGEVRTIQTNQDTGVATATPGDLGNIEQGTFIGTANVERSGNHTALEMVIFPPSMKGTGLGNYAWDLSPSEVNQSVKSSESVGNGGSATAGSSMTNGTVTSRSSGGEQGSMTAGSSMTNGTVTSRSSGGQQNAMTSGSSMTNGTVTQQSGDSGNTITLQVDYGEGSKTIVVPEDVPTVKLAPGSLSDLNTGAHAFVVVSGNDNGGYVAKKIIVGKNGTVPPM